MFIKLMVGCHRALFTVATALVGVSGSLVADNPNIGGHYIFLAGSLVLMYVEDECSEIEQASRALGNPGSLMDARVDVFETHNARLLYALAALALSLLVAGVVFTAST